MSTMPKNALKLRFILFFTQYWCQTTNLGPQRRSNMLGGISNELFYARQNFLEESFGLQKAAKS